MLASIYDFVLYWITPPDALDPRGIGPISWYAIYWGIVTFIPLYLFDRFIYEPEQERANAPLRKRASIEYRYHLMEGHPDKLYAPPGATDGESDYWKSFLPEDDPDFKPREKCYIPPMYRRR